MEAFPLIVVQSWLRQENYVRIKSFGMAASNDQASFGLAPVAPELLRTSVLRNSSGTIHSLSIQTQQCYEATKDKM